MNNNGEPADTRTPLQQLAIKHLIGLLINELSPDINGDGQSTHAEWLQYLKEMAIVARNYG